MTDYNVTVELGGQEIEIDFSGAGGQALEQVEDIQEVLRWTTDNTFFGSTAGDSVTSGTNNTGIGAQALTAVTTGARNTALGDRAGQSLTTGTDNTSLGYLAGQLGTTRAQSVSVGSQTLRKNVTGARNTSVGYKAGSEYLASDITAVGSEALWQATGASNTALGSSAGGSITTGFNCVFVGSACGGGVGTPNNIQYSIGIGFNVQVPSSNMIVLGDTNQSLLLMFGITAARWDETLDNLGLFGGGTSPATHTGGNNIAIGKDAGIAQTTASSNVYIGQSAGEELQTGNGNVMIGVTAARHSDAIFDCTIVGTTAARNVANGTGLTAVGYRAQQFALTAFNNSTLGDSTLWRSQGDRCVAIGYVAAEYNGEGDDCIYIGQACGRNRESGDRNIFMGTFAGGFASATVVPNDTTGEASGTIAAGNRVVGIGYHSLWECTGSDHTALGDNTGTSLTGGSDSVFIGSGAGTNGSQKVDPVNQIVIGADAFGTADNQVVLGNASVTETVLRGVQKGTVLTVAALPAAASSVGCRAFVSNSNAAASGNFGAVVAGGGANTVPVFCDGAQWRIG